MSVLDLFKLDGKTALVTGARRGIGKAMAVALAEAGADVIGVSRSLEPGSEVEREVTALGRKFTSYACDFAKRESVYAFLRELPEHIDILVNNAGTNVAQGPCLDMDDAQFDKMIEINLKSAFRLMNAVAPSMCVRGSGSIVNIASISGLRPQHHGMLYSMTKAALIMMTQSYALELGPRGVRVNAIAPGLIQTKLSEYYWKDETRRTVQIERQPIRHLGQPDEIAEAAVMLAGDGASYMTGQTLVVDGGFLLSSI